FRKFLAFSLADGLLTADEEKTLLRFGTDHGLNEQEICKLIEEELKNSGASRAPLVSEPVAGSRELNGTSSIAADPRAEFMRMLRLSGLDGDAMTNDQRDA